MSSSPPVPRVRQITRVAGALLQARLLRRRPLVLTFAVTEACNARCPYCVFRHGRRGSDELNLDEIRQMFLDSASVGVQYVHLWGGEPLVHPQIGEIMEAAKEAGLLVGMVTNAMLLERKAVAVTAYTDRLYVSLDHPTDHHDTMRATRGLFDAAVRGICAVRARDSKKPILVSYTLCRDNADALDDMLVLCRELGMSLYINPMRAAANAAGDAPAARNEEVFTVDNEDRILSWTEQQEIWWRLIERKQQGWPIQNTFAYMRQIATSGEAPVYRCHWPKVALAIDANGDIVDCQRWDRPIANLRDTSLEEVLAHPRSEELAGPAGEACNTCISPARFEPSGIWGLKPSVLAQSLRGLAR